MEENPCFKDLSIFHVLYEMCFTCTTFLVYLLWIYCMNIIGKIMRDDLLFINSHKIWFIHWDFSIWYLLLMRQLIHNNGTIFTVMIPAMLSLNKKITINVIVLIIFGHRWLGIMTLDSNFFHGHLSSEMYQKLLHLWLNGP